MRQTAERVTAVGVSPAVVEPVPRVVTGAVSVQLHVHRLQRIAGGLGGDVATDAAVERYLDDGIGRGADAVQRDGGGVGLLRGVLVPLVRIHVVPVVREELVASGAE